MFEVFTPPTNHALHIVAGGLDGGYWGIHYGSKKIILLYFSRIVLDWSGSLFVGALLGQHEDV